MSEIDKTYEGLKEFAQEAFPLRGPNSEVDQIIDLANHGNIEAASFELAVLQKRDVINTRQYLVNEFGDVREIEINDDNKLDILSKVFLLGLKYGRLEGAEVVEDWKDHLVPASNKEEMTYALENRHSPQNKILDVIAEKISSKAIKEVEIYGGAIVSYILKRKKINGFNTARQYAQSSIRNAAKNELINTLIKLGFSDVPFNTSVKSDIEDIV